MRRRAFLETPVASAAGVVDPVVSETPAATMGALRSEWERLERTTHEPGETDDSFDARVDALSARQEQIRETACLMATTDPGVVAEKLRLLRAILNNNTLYDDGRELALIDSIERDLRAMGGPSGRSAGC